MLTSARRQFRSIHQNANHWSSCGCATPPYLGSIGIRALMRYRQRLLARGGLLILCRVSDPVYDQLKRTGTLEKMGGDNVIPAEETIFGATEHALTRAQHWLQSVTASPQGHNSY
ncbi:MAG: STAS domain-containing protein [Chloroflexota bacterium]